MVSKFKLLFGALTLIMLYSCASKLPVYKVSNSKKSETLSEKYDSDAKLGYTVSKDEKNLYVTLNTTDTPAQLKMLNKGVILFFDASGKKEENVFLQYPVPPSKPSRPDFESLKENKTAFLENLILELPSDIYSVNYDQKTYLNKELNTENIKVKLEVVEEELFYRIQLPLSYIPENKNEMPSMGIVIEGIERPENAQGNRGGGRPAGVGGGRPSGAGGGRPAGVGGGRPSGAGGGRPSGNAASQSPFAGLSDDIKIWFLLELNPKP